MNISFVLPYLADRFDGPVTGAKNIGRCWLLRGIMFPIGPRH
jgi:hypothetical protein